MAARLSRRALLAGVAAAALAAADAHAVGFVLNPYRLAAAGGAPSPVTRQVYSSEGLGEVTNTDATTPTALVTLTFTPDANKTYALLWSAEATSSLTEGFVLTLTEAGSEVLRAQEPQKEVTSPPDYKQRGGVYIHTAGASPASTSWVIKVARPSGGSSTCKARNGRLIAIRLETGDEFASSTGVTSTTGAGYVDKASLSFSTSGDYLVIASASFETAAANDDSFIRLEDGGATSAAHATSEGSTTTTGVFVQTVVWHRAGLTGAHTIKTQFQAGTGDTIDCSKNYMVALHLGAMYDAIVSTLGSDNGGTNTSYTDALSVTDTPAAADHLTIANWFVRGDSTSVTGQAQFRDGGSSLAQNIAEPADTSAGIGQSCFVAKFATYAAASRTWDIQRLSETSGLTTTVNAGAVIAALQLAP